MKTINAVYLRKNLGDVIKRTQNGESFLITYRSGIRVKLQPENVQAVGTPGLDALNKVIKTNPYQKANLKQEYRKLINQKYAS